MKDSYLRTYDEKTTMITNITRKKKEVADKK